MMWAMHAYWSGALRQSRALRSVSADSKSSAAMRLSGPLVADERGWSLGFAMGGVSLALLAAGLVSPRVGRLIVRHGGHRVMPIGSLLGAVGLALIVYAVHPAAYLAVWILLGVATA